MIKLIHYHKGMVLVESLLVIPLLLLLMLGIIQFTFIYLAKTSLDHATFMAARMGAVEQGSQSSLMHSLSSSMISLFSNDKDTDLALYRKVRRELESNSQIRIMNPTWEAFMDYGESNHRHELEIPNDRLSVRGTHIGSLSQLNIQDANLLKIQVIYGFPLEIPFVNHIILKTAGLFMVQDRYRDYLSDSRLPILSTAMVRMQSRIRYNSWVMTRQEVDAASAN